MFKIEFNDLKAQYRHLKPEIDQGIQEVLNSAAFISGPQVSELEQALCAYTGSKHCLTCSNGTDALLIPLMAWGIGPGDSVFIPAFTFVATAEVVSLAGAVPVFCDVYEDTFNLNPESLRTQIEAVLREGKLRPKAVIAVDLFGQPVEYPAIREICDLYGLKLIEDAAQGFGGRIGSRKACTFGDVSTTSFFPAKPLGCYGDGGAIFTDDGELAAIMDSIRIHGKGAHKYENVRIGLNARLDTVQAAVLLPKLRAFDLENQVRADMAEMYSRLLSSVTATPIVRKGYTSSWAQYTVKTENSVMRQKWIDALKAEGIPSMIYYPLPLHLQKAFSFLGYKEGDFPVSEDLSRRVLSLPIHGYMEEKIVQKVCNTICKALY